jgi:hypothetical protein
MQFTDSVISSTGAFLVGELEKLDPKLYEPISDFTWSRDIQLRTDVAIADEVTSFITSEYAGGFGIHSAGKSFIRGASTTPATLQVRMNKVMTPLTPWGMELDYTIFDLEKAMKAGRPIDAMKHEALRQKHNLDIDQMVYLGDTEVGVAGLLNNAAVTKSNIGAFDASALTAEKAIEYFNTILDAAWKATSYTRIPNVMLVPPALFAAMSSKQLTNTSMNLLQYVQSNNLSVSNGGSLTIRPVKYLADATTFGNGRIVAYTNDPTVVRFPLVQLQSLPVQFRDYRQIVPYYGALGGVEFVRPEMVFYGDLAD